MIGFELRRIGAVCLSAALMIGTTSGGTLAAGPAAPARPRAAAPAAPAAGPAAQQQSQAAPIIPNLPVIPQTPETIDRELQLESEGEKLLDKHELDKALIKFQEAYGLSLEMKYSDGQGRALSHMCELYLARGQATKAKELGENAIEVLSESADKRALGKARVALAQAYFAIDNPVWAGNQLDLALKSFTQFGANDAPEAAKVLALAANILVKMGKIKEAMQFSQQAATYYSQAGNYPAAIQTRITLSGMMREVGWLVAALEEANKALDEARSAKDKSYVPAALASVAVAQYSLGEYDNARRSYEELIYLKSDNDLAIARLYAGYGHTLAATGDLEPARGSLELALKTVRTKGQPIEQTQILNTLGCIESLEGNKSKALPYFNQALEELALVQPKQDRFNITILQNIAATEARSGDFRSAKGHLLQIIPILKKSKDEVVDGRIAASLGEVCLGLQDPGPAEQYLRQGITISEKINDDAALWRDYTNLAALQIAQGQSNLARESLTSALSFFRSPQAGWFASPEQLGFPSTREDLGQQLVSLLVSEGFYEQALLAAEQLKEESFINEWLRRGGEVKPFDRDIYRDLVCERAHLHAAEITSTPDKMVKDWKNWLARFKQLAASNRALARLVAPIPVPASEMIKGVLNNHAVAVDYLVGGKSTVVFTIDNSGKLLASTLPVGREQLKDQISALLAASSKEGAEATGNERRTLQLLYAELFPDTVRAVLPANPDQTVVILPDGVLFNLPFAALLDQGGKFLVEKHTLTLASSMGVFLDSPPPYKQDVSLLLASADPANGASSADEASQIASLFQPDLVTKLAGREAEVENLQAQARERSVMHFSSKLSLADSNPMHFELPILLSKDDAKFKVTAGHLFGLNLPSDLAVWSSTAVNTKDPKGTAVKVFSRGLGYAGVRNVLISLWVEPEPQRTSELMDFYKGSQKGLNQAQSLRKAQLLALSKNPSPRAWAAFQLLGPGY